jgi:hypothetical protein
VVLNYSDQPQRFAAELDTANGTVCYSTHKRDGKVDLTNLEVTPFEILIVAL